MATVPGDPAAGPVPVLLVADPARRGPLQAVLAAPDVRLECVDSVDEAGRRLERGPVAVVVLPLQAGGPCGVETARRLRARQRDCPTPVLFVCGREAPFPTARAYALGAVDHLDEPIVPEALRTKVALFGDLYRANERQQIRRAAEADAKFRTMFEQGTQFAGILSPAGTVVEVNRLCLDACGFTREDVLGKPFWECGWWNRSPVLMETVRAACRQAAAGTLFRTESRYFVADGSERFVDLIIAPVTDQGGRVLFVAPTGTDITDRKRGQMLAAGQKEAFELAVDGAPLADVLEVLVCTARQIAGEDARAALFVADQDGRHLRFGAATGVPEAYWRVVEGFEIGPQSPPCGTAAHTGQTVIIGDVTKDPLWANCLHLAREHEIRACWCEPITSPAGKVFGTISLYHPVPREPGPGDLDALRHLGHAAALVLQRYRGAEERRRAEAALQESEARQRTLADNLPAGFIYQVAHEADGSRRFTYVSAGIEAVCGVRPAEVVADPARLYGLIAAKDRARVATAEDAASRSGSQFDCQFRVRAGSQERWLHCRSASRALPGGGVVWDGVALDVTDHVRAEEALVRLTAESERRRRLFETILASTPDLVYVFGLDHRFTYANTALLRMWGRTWDAAIGKNCRELGYEPWHAAMHDREIEQVVATRRAIRGEVPFTGTDGRRIYEYIFVPVLGADGAVEAVAGTTRDVTERKAMEDALRESDRKKGDFIALLAHELRNPLAPVRNGLQVMRLAGGNVDAVARARAMMDRQLTHMVRLIDDLLDVSRISRNKMELRRGRVLLADVIASAVETARPAIEAVGHELTLSLPPGPVFLDADLTRLSQVVSNLLTNSAKYTPPGGSIHLSAERQAGDVVLTVRDTGIGIPADALPTIFDMFSQVDRSVERNSGGLGIGLALVKGLVEMHGGTVTAASEGEGRGSTFTVCLPVTDARPGARGPAATDEPRRGRGRRVLVVDDNRDGAESMAMMLRLLGDEVRTAHDGQQAVETAETFRPDVILMDVGMPRMNGLDATRQIREQPWGKAVTIIALTGWGQDHDRERSRAAGCDGHLVKPVGLPELEKLLVAPPGEPVGGR